MSFDTIVKKANGDTEVFNPAKLKNSLDLAGASGEESEIVLEKIREILYKGITTRKIYRKAFSELKKIKKEAALSYSLNEAVMGLGPTGFPFEKFVARVFSRLGYETEVGLMMKGMCIEHEIDFLARHDSHIFVAETKFHNEHGIKSNLQTALFVKARFDDLWESPHLSAKTKPHAVWLITNTKFTKSALTYGECAGINMISWNHPKEGNLQDLIEKSKLHPVTAITSLSKKEKKRLMENNVVLCRDIVEHSEKLELYGVNPKKHKTVLSEAESIIDLNNNREHKDRRPHE